MNPSMRSVPDPAAPAPVCDFVGGSFGHRLRAGFGRREPLARAVGLRGVRTPAIVDATAGLGRDAFLLASLGLTITLIERSPAMHGQLAEGLARALEAGGAAGAAAARMTLLLGDARALLPSFAPDVVLVDPMHPPRSKSALVKQEMRRVRDAVGADEDAIELVQAARAAARDRTVLKWPLHAPPLAGLPAPHHSLRTRTVRFDVFMRPAE